MNSLSLSSSLPGESPRSVPGIRWLHTELLGARTLLPRAGLRAGGESWHRLPEGQHWSSNTRVTGGVLKGLRSRHSWGFSGRWEASLRTPQPAQHPQVDSSSSRWDRGSSFPSFVFSIQFLCFLSCFSFLFKNMSLSCSNTQRHDEGQRSLTRCSPWGRKSPDATEQLSDRRWS